MRIAIVGPGFTGATFPLANYLVKKGLSVDCYYFTQIGLKSIESLDFDCSLSSKPVIWEIEKANKLYDYLDNSIGVSIIPIHKRHKKLEKLLIGLFPLVSNYFRTKYFVKVLLAKRYDRIILIDHFETEQIGKALLKANVKFVTSYHEVLDSLTGEPVLRKRVVESVGLKRPIILHCNDVKEYLLKLSHENDLSSRISIMRVGPFESLWQYGEGKEVPGVGKNYFLFMGRLTPYKGLGVLVDAMTKIEEKKEWHVVIAGNGTDPALARIYNDKRYKLINRYIANDEMVWLVRNCRAVVCPYIAASQSGLMPLAFAYNKPIIATKVGAFPEVIVDGTTGYLSETPTGDGFYEAISRFLKEENCFRGEPLPESIRWDYIATQVVELLNKL